ncbi:MAG: hypothetical protein ABFD97_25430 [Syntrophobacter sp.]
MSSPFDEKNRKSPRMEDTLLDDYARSRREGAFISPCGTEGCQWDGFPEPPDAQTEETESE